MYVSYKTQPKWRWKPTYLAQWLNRKFVFVMMLKWMSNCRVVIHSHVPRLPLFDLLINAHKQKHKTQISIAERASHI